ncbi:hypothetical protein [Actinomycetospora soli]|uniref:hypothetical protein n=1 Tax=Actinomycetospora soli TaxID=2893887 RepID=UPI001E47A664|nr:hypothetical protein [Actinomycetospora soli]MCD2187803.1 hypothetical protein [Actinomycetospora soli]
MTVEEPRSAVEFDVLDRLLADRAAPLLAARRADVIAWLASPHRGPGPGGTRALVEVLRVLGPTPVLERAWLRWIEEGRFDGHPDDEGGATARDLVEGLHACVEHQVFGEDHALVHGALVHWSGLLRSAEPDRRRRGFDAVVAVVESGRPFPTALPQVVERALRGDRSEEAARLRAGVDALFRRDAQDSGSQPPGNT